MIGKSRIVIIFCLALFTLTAAGQVRQTENTFKLADGKSGDKAVIADMIWLAGTWTGSAMGGTSEEIWSKPQSGVMMGMYRMIKDEKPVFYELMTLSEADGTLIVRLKHFSADFTGWEEKDKTVDFKFVRKDAKRFYFEGMTFEPVGSTGLNIYVAMGQKDGSVTEEVFKYTRVK